jgi:uncharacterized membrane protein YphA (DoxX/SURF4 family)
MKRRAHVPLGGLLYFFGIIFLYTAGLGFMLTPVGPLYKNVPWLSLAAIGLLVMLLVAELLPHHEKAVVVDRKKFAAEQDLDESVLEKEFSILLLLILLLLVGGIIYVVLSKPEKFHMTF